MQLTAIRTRLVKQNSDLAETIFDSATREKLKIENGDIIAVASKVVATVQNQVKKLDAVKPSEQARELARAYALEPNFVEIVLQEADRVYGGVQKALLALKDDILTANAGVDHKNAPKGYAVAWPKDPFRTAENLRRRISEITGKRVGVIIVDSRVTPLRLGTTGLALAAAGFETVKDHRGATDLYGKSILITRHAVADDLASAAHLLMGESNEQTPIVLIKGAPVKATEYVEPSSLVIPPKQCLYTKYVLKGAVKERL